MRRFALDPRLAKDTHHVAMLGLCDLRIMRDARWPWAILIPKRNDIVEFHDLSPLDQTMLTFETSLVAKAMKRLARADKLNIATLGNVVSMFHLHVVARHAGDPNWPNPVWGFGESLPYEAARLERFADELKREVLAQ
ncbi:hypothetical protein GCM10011390_31200 [Aureimonas endophytica]|uniref:HIT domain-containing protein n=1 Tax=Aureimonas endophytica TaxID=2027858 RepID=A0A916ZR07_9HYPH|nr:HIT family protein [Aureimonas endophytica]GGE09896.1 hypothetical protein GCM10011390_31200 [Aureimonas endophytica]